MRSKSPQESSSILKKKILEKRDVTISGRKLHLEVSKSAAFCPVPYKGSVALGITGDVNALFFGSSKQSYTLRVSRKGIDFSGTKIQFGNTPDLIQVNGECRWIGLPGSPLVIEFGDGVPIGYVF
jgi:hypothetical protein